MKAIVIDGKTQELSMTEAGRMEDIAAIIGQDTVISDEIDDNNRVYFDEDCFIRGTEGRFQIDSLAPIAGKAVVVGGEEGAPAEVSLELDALRDRVKFL